MDECPIAAGNKHIGFKEALNVLEEKSPGTKASYYLGFLDRMAPVLAGIAASGADSVTPCMRCGAPTGGEEGSVCAFCRLVERSAAHEPVSVELILKKSRSQKRAQSEVAQS